MRASKVVLRAGTRRSKRKKSRKKYPSIGITAYSNPKKRRKKRKKNPQKFYASVRSRDVWGTKKKYSTSQSSPKHPTKAEVRKIEQRLAQAKLVLKYAKADGKKTLAAQAQKVVNAYTKDLIRDKTARAKWLAMAASVANKGGVSNVRAKRVSSKGKPYKARKKKKKATKKKKVSKAAKARKAKSIGSKLYRARKGRKGKIKINGKTLSWSMNPKRRKRRKKSGSRKRSKLGGNMRYKKNPTFEQLSGYSMTQALSLLGGGATYGAVNNWVQRIPGISGIMAQLQSVFGALGPGVANSVAPLLFGAGLKYGADYVPNAQAKEILNSWGEGLVAASFTAVGAALGQQVAGAMSGVIYQPEMGAVDYTSAGQIADFGGEGGFSQMGVMPEGLGYYHEGQLGQEADPGMEEYFEDKSDYGTFSPGGLN
jgi:hypothetical protein